MAYNYQLIVEEDIDALGVPIPSPSELASFWSGQSAESEFPEELTPHSVHAWRQQWFANHRTEMLGDIEALIRAHECNAGWRLLLEEVPALHSAYYSESATAFFSSVDALAQVSQFHNDIPADVAPYFTALVHALVLLSDRKLRFRFDYID
jgi:hypothetical protein